MIYRASFIVLLIGWLSAQSPSAPCCTCDTSGPERPDDVVCLNAKEMRGRVDHVEPLKPSGLDKGLNLRGTVALEIRFDASGKLACARAKSGHPIAIAAAMDAVRRWTFRPLMSNGAAKGGCGPITIKYRLREKGSSTELQ
jgi:TonB family protein